LEFDISGYLDARDGYIKIAILMGYNTVEVSHEVPGVSKPQILKPET
jgi:hypothetical protein